MPRDGRSAQNEGCDFVCFLYSFGHCFNLPVWGLFVLIFILEKAGAYLFPSSVFEREYEIRWTEN